MMHNRIHISRGNTKIGETGNISLLPIITCPEGVPCAKYCYARGLAYSPTALKAWADNTAYAQNDLSAYMDDVEAWIQTYEPAFFRWHTSGDAPSARYAFHMVGIALRNPKTRFLVFTKRYQYNWTYGRPFPNLTVYHSAWPGLVLPTKEERDKLGVSAVAWLDGDTRIPEGTPECKGRCDQCRFCWNIGGDVVLHKHGLGKGAKT